jgi:hypothetical protein
MDIDPIVINEAARRYLHWPGNSAPLGRRVPLFGLS